MPTDFATTFMEALRELEETGNVDKIVSLFSDNCEVGNVTLSHSLSGAGGAREFWEHYRKTFGDLKSEFRNTIVAGNSAALEWTTSGTAANGHAIGYEGVSVLEQDDGGKIKRFFAYFNPGKLGAQISEAANA